MGGANIYDLGEHGAVAGQVCDEALARIAAELAAHDPGNPGTTAAVLRIPGAPLPFYYTPPLWITRSNLTVEGEGRDVSWLAARPGYNSHMIVAGINTGVPGGIPSGDHFLPLDGFGDGTLAGGQGLRLREDMILAFWSTPLDQPMAYLQPVNRGWSDFRQVTFTLVLDDRGEPLPVGPLYGMGEVFPHGYQARPCHLLNLGGGWLEFRFTTAESPDQYRSFLMAEGPPSGCREIAVQLDLLTCRAQAYRNRTQVDAWPFVNMGPTSSRTRDLSFTPADQLRLVQNAYHPFLVGGYGSNTQSRGSGPVMDLSLCGLAISRGLLFADDGVGKPQRALDGATVTTAYLARPPQATLLGRLAIESIRPTNPLGGREVPVVIGGACGQGGGVACGLLSPVEQQINCKNWLTNLTFRNFSLRGSGWYGDGLSLGGAWNVLAENLYLDGGYCNLGSPRMGPSTYKLKLSGIRFGFSFGAAYFGHSHIADAADFQVSSALRNTVTTVGSDLTLRDAFIAASVNDTTIACYAEDNGGDYRFENIKTDNEGNVTPTRMFLIEPPWNKRTSLVIDGVSTGTMGPRAAVVEFQKVPGLPAEHYPVSLRNLKTDQTGCLIRTDHPRIAGEIDADTAHDDVYPWLEFAGGITSTDLTIRSARYPVPPARLPWTDTTVLDVRHPVLGLPTRYRCIRSGEYGTATVPAWRGEAIQDDGTDTALGACSTNSETIAATVSGVPSIGGLYSDFARHTLLDYWLRGVAAPPPASLTLQPSLYTHNPLDAGYPWYPRAPASGNFATAAGRGTTSTAGITFPAPTPYDLSDTNSLLLLDPASRVIWQVRLARGIPSARTDPALTIAAGGIVISGGAATGTPGGNPFDEFRGGFTTWALNAETDFWHRGVALPAVAGRYLGLATGLANREGTVSEPAGNGYARVSLSPTDFAPAAEGRSVLAVPLSWPAATRASWTTVRSVFLADAASRGKILWMANLVTARIARSSGVPLRFAPGALVVVK
jgi:hypothetical protein